MPAQRDGSELDERNARYHLYRDAGVPAPRTAYARLYIAIAGQPEKHAGLDSLVDNVDDPFAAANFTNKGGVFLKPVSSDLFRFLGEDWAKYNETYDPKSNLTADQKKKVIDFTRRLPARMTRNFAQLGGYLELDALPDTWR